MENFTTIQIPFTNDLEDIKRTLHQIIIEIDKLKGLRGLNPSVYKTEFFENSLSISENINNLQILLTQAQNDINTLQSDLAQAQNDINTLQSDLAQAQNDINTLQNEDLTFVKLDGSRQITGILTYDSSKTFGNPTDLISKEYVDNNFTNNPQQPNIAILTQTISNPPTQAEVQAIQDKINEIIVALQNANIIL